MREKMAAPRNRNILVSRDMVKIWLNPTSENHHQSVTRKTRVEKKIKERARATTAIPVKNLTIFTAKKL